MIIEKENISEMGESESNSLNTTLSVVPSQACTVLFTAGSWNWWNTWVETVQNWEIAGTPSKSFCFFFQARCLQDLLHQQGYTC